MTDFITYSGMTASSISVRMPVKDVKNMASEPLPMEKAHGQAGSGLGQDKTNGSKNSRD